MDHTASTRFARHRSARHGARRRERRARAAWQVAAVFLLLALAGGFVTGNSWWRVRSKAASTEAVTSAQRAKARLLLDRAVQARHAGSADEALRLASEARTAEPGVPGAALFAAEMALRRGEPEIAGAVASGSLGEAQYAADARLILAISGWMLRSQTGSEAAGASATQLLAEAAEEELSNGAVRFFAGDLQRAVGRPAEAHRSLLGGLYRQHAWQSAAVLAAKIALSRDEVAAYGGGAQLDVDEEPGFFGAAATALVRAIRGEAESAFAAHGVCLIFTRKHLAILAHDPALVEVLRIEDGIFLPFGEIAPPTVEPESIHFMPWDQESKVLNNK